MISLKEVVEMLLNGVEVVIKDGFGVHYEVKLEKLREGVQLCGGVSLMINSERLTKEEK